MMRVEVVLLVLAVVVEAVVCEQLWQHGAEFEVSGQLHMNEAEAAALAPDVATRLRVQLRVLPLWARAQETLLQFEALEAWSEARGPEPHAEFSRRRGPWDALAGSSWAARFDAGRITQFYADPTQSSDFLNYQRALTSLFQFQLSDGEHNETDVSGTCNVLYERVSADIIRKIKRACVWGEQEEALRCRRVARASLAAGGVRELFADEVCALGAGAAVKARGWVSLRRVATPRAPPPAATPDPPPPLAPLPLPLQPAADDAQMLEPPMILEDALKQYGEVLNEEEAGAGGTEEGALAALEVMGAMQHADVAALREALAAEGPGAGALWRLAGAAGTRAAHAAVAPLLREPHPHAAHYLRGLSLALRPPDEAVRDVLELAERAGPLQAAATLAAGAAARGGRPALRRDVAAALRGRLQRCADDECRVPALLALGSLRAGADELLGAAEAGGARAAAAALRALGALPLCPRALRRLARVAGSEARPLPVRAGALRLALRGWLRASPPLLQEAARLAAALAPARHHELRRLLWGQLAALPAPAVAQLQAMLPPHVRCWHTLANAGTSVVLERETGWGAAGWRGVLSSVQVAGGGILQRGGVTLTGRAADGAERELLAVDVWTQGLGAWAGAGAGGGGGEDEDAAAGLVLEVGGAALLDATLFSSQGELLSLLWAGAGSTDTPVLRAFLPLQGAGGAAVLATQGALLRGRGAAGLLLALDAAASVSLWGRTAAARMQLRGAAAAAARLGAGRAGGGAAAAARGAAGAALLVAADLDFYSSVALCVRAGAAAQRGRVSARLAAEAPRHALRRRRERSLVSAPRTLSLGRDNDRTCRSLGTSDL